MLFLKLLEIFHCYITCTYLIKFHCFSLKNEQWYNILFAECDITTVVNVLYESFERVSWLYNNFQAVHNTRNIQYNTIFRLYFIQL